MKTLIDIVKEYDPKRWQQEVESGMWKDAQDILDCCYSRLEQQLLVVQYAESVVLKFIDAIDRLGNKL